MKPKKSKEMEISAEKQEILEKIKKGHNVFITGPAGTGKSFLLKLIKKFYQAHGLHITASTGVAAVEVGGVTIHSWAGIGLGNRPASEIISYILSGRGTFLRRKIRKTKMLAIDEISMIPALVLDLLDKVFKAVRDNAKPFGGIQMILFGDFLQLSPINKDDNFCFQAESWHNANFQIFNLQDMFRQNETHFINLLNNLRFGKMSPADIALLESRKSLVPDSEIKPTIICTHNAQIDIINKKELSKLLGTSHVFTMKATGKEEKVNFLKKNCLAEEQLVLKIGAQVMMLKNSLQKDGIINGSLGVVKSFNSQGFPVVRFANNKTFTILAEEWLIEEFNDQTQEVSVKAKVLQVPLVLAWAITVHKSQGMTLDAINCDLGSSFAEGQVYVALSRVKSIEGLFLSSFNAKQTMVNKSVVEFYQQISNNALV
jgi:ATP-dependent DNA helicase PIF1